MAVPSLHVWAALDEVTGARSAELVARFADARTLAWERAHVVPTAAVAIVAWVAARAV